MLGLVAAVGLGGCGEKQQGQGQGQPAAPATTAAAPTQTATTAGTQPSAPAPAPKPPAGTRTQTAPGGNGGTEPARSDIAFTGRGGRIEPRQVSVAPFIAVRISLTSADGRTYTLRRSGFELAAGGATRTRSASLPGLATGRTYSFNGGAVTIVSSGEPGP